MLAHLLEHRRRGALETTLSAARRLLRQQDHRAVDADAEYLLDRARLA
jgi:hypothetical protein